MTSTSTLRRCIAPMALLALLLPASAAGAKDGVTYVVSGHAVVDHGGGVTSERTTDVAGDATTLSATGLHRLRVMADAVEIDLTGAVDCLNVVGDTAYLSGVIIASNRVDIAIGTAFYTSLTDGSSSGAADIVAPVYLNPGITCASTTFAPEFVVTSGDVSILACEKLKMSGKCKPKGD